MGQGCRVLGCGVQRVLPPFYIMAIPPVTSRLLSVPTLRKRVSCCAAMTQSPDYV
jgi:hypothetical protein